MDARNDITEVRDADNTGTALATVITLERMAAAQPNTSIAAAIRRLDLEVTNITIAAQMQDLSRVQRIAARLRRDVATTTEALTREAQRARDAEHRAQTHALRAEKELSDQKATNALTTSTDRTEVARLQSLLVAMQASFALSAAGAQRQQKPQQPAAQLAIEATSARQQKRARRREAKRALIAPYPAIALPAPPPGQTQQSEPIIEEPMDDDDHLRDVTEEPKEKDHRRDVTTEHATEDDNQTAHITPTDDELYDELMTF